MMCGFRQSPGSVLLLLSVLKAHSCSLPEEISSTIYLDSHKPSVRVGAFVHWYIAACTAALQGKSRLYMVLWISLSFSVIVNTVMVDSKAWKEKTVGLTLLHEQIPPKTPLPFSWIFTSKCSFYSCTLSKHSVWKPCYFAPLFCP